MTTTKHNLLQIEGLTVDFDAGKPTEHRALDGVCLRIREGDSLGLVGESGSGKTVLAHTILGLLPAGGRVSGGRIEWKGRDLLGQAGAEMRQIRGGEIAMIFQDPQASLNPVYCVGHQIEWILKLHRGLEGPAAKSEILHLFDSVQLRDPERCYRCYPHELSGGMCQRVMIAMALGCRPKLLIADEPTSALDVTIQAEIVELLADICVKYEMAMLFITHDLGVAGRLCKNVMVLQGGKVVESGPIRDVFSSPTASYTRKLLKSVFVPTFNANSLEPVLTSVR